MPPPDPQQYRLVLAPSENIFACRRRCLLWPYRMGIVVPFLDHVLPRPSSLSIPLAWLFEHQVCSLASGSGHYNPLAGSPLELWYKFIRYSVVHVGSSEILRSRAGHYDRSCRDAASDVRKTAGLLCPDGEGRYVRMDPLSMDGHGRCR